MASTSDTLLYSPLLSSCEQKRRRKGREERRKKRKEGEKKEEQKGKKGRIGGRKKKERRMIVSNTVKRSIGFDKNQYIRQERKKECARVSSRVKVLCQLKFG